MHSVTVSICFRICAVTASQMSSWTFKTLVQQYGSNYLSQLFMWGRMTGCESNLPKKQNRNMVHHFSAGNLYLGEIQ